MLVIGHRGAAGAVSENSLAAFQAAVDQRADGVELDVRRTADGALALSHDEILSDGRALVDLQQVELPAEVPILAAALDVCRPLAVVNIEIKNWPQDRDFDPAEHVAIGVVALLDARRELDDGRNLISSFHLPTLERVRQLAPSLPTGWLLGLVEDPAPIIERAARHGFAAVHPHHAFVSGELVARAHDAGLAVNTWTCDEPERIRWLADVGVDAVITNHPDVALAALGR